MAVVEQTPWLNWRLLTKRPKVARQWFTGRRVPANVWLGTTAENQKMLKLRATELLAIKAPLHFLSYEPALGPIDIYKADAPQRLVDSRGKAHSLRHEPGAGLQLDHVMHWDFRWVLAGGESGPKARPASRGAVFL